MNLVVTLKLRSVFNDSYEWFLIHLKCCSVYDGEFSLLCPVILFCPEGVVHSVLPRGLSGMKDEEINGNLLAFAGIILLARASRK